ncbi:histidine phosphatase superfamily [Cladorrhinum sp. PSN332]|nr:histidine phosphatase superfamily [Cladorrhinum sp. PSN332]
MFLNGLTTMLRHGASSLLAFAGLVSSQTVDTSWYPPKQTRINNLTAVLSDSGTYGWIFNSSHTPDELYGTYNWRDMPHVRQKEYPFPSKNYELIYVEVIQRHHLRTPYSSNAFPIEPPWNCSDVALFYHSQPLSSSFSTTPSYWQLTPPSFNALPGSGLTGTCLFPQITLPGLQDSFTHGADLYTVYSSLLPLNPSSVSFRVTTNQITSQVASALITPFNLSAPYPLTVQPPALDSLEPKYLCPLSSSLFSSIQSSSNPRWAEHLRLLKPLFATLDSISGVRPDDKDFHKSADHYFDNLSAKQCHSLPLPCSASNPALCIKQKEADLVYRIGQWEYDHVFRSAGPDTLKASAASQGVWIAELAQHLREAITYRDDDDGGSIKYRHNIAHDGSVSRVLSILQADEMVWPGMGAEIVFELWEDNTTQHKHKVRVLFGGRVLKSSNPSLGEMDMLDLEILLGYFDGLVGKRAEKVRGLCGL